jgi:hypothetical protein
MTRLDNLSSEQPCEPQYSPSEAKTPASGEGGRKIELMKEASGAVDALAQAGQGVVNGDDDADFGGLSKCFCSVRLCATGV